MTRLHAGSGLSGLLFCLAFALIAANLAIPLALVHDLRTGQIDVDRALDTRAALDALRVGLLDAQDAEERHRPGGDPAQAQSFDAAVKSVHAALQALPVHLADDPVQLERLGAIEKLARSELARLGERMEARSTDAATDASTPQQERTDALADARVLADAMRDHADRRIELQRQQLEQRRRAMVYGFCALTLAGLLLLTAARLIARRQRGKSAHVQSARLRAEEEAARLAAIVQASPVAMLSRTLDGRILSWNAGAERLFGWTAEEAVGRDLLDLTIPPECELDRIELTERLVRGEPVHDFETVRLRKDGTAIEVSITVSPLRDAITTRAPDGTLASWNAAAERLFGYTAAEAVGQTPDLIVPPDKLEELRSIEARLARGEELSEVRTVRLHKDGTRIPVSLSFSPIRIEGGAPAGFAVAVRDTSAEVRAEAEAKRRHALTELMAALAAAANEAASPEAAMRECLAHICLHGRWDLGHLMMLAREEDRFRVVGSTWTPESDERFVTFRDFSDGKPYFGGAGGFLPKALFDQQPVWASDLTALPRFRRGAHATACGLRCGFAFPVTSGGEVRAILEFFADETREPDTGLLEVIPGVASQLARLIERKQALDAVKAYAEHMQGILGALREVVWSCDPRTRALTYINTSGAKLYGRTEFELLAAPSLWREAVHADDRERLEAGIAIAAAEGEFETEVRIEHPDGHPRIAQVNARLTRGRDGRALRLDGTMTDVTDRRRAEERVGYLAQYDPVTGLPNRRLFQDRLSQALARAKRSGRSVALVLVDLDRFRQINEALGHEAGDRVLTTIAARLNGHLREVDTIARPGGDEIAIVVENVEQSVQATRIASKVLEITAKPIDIDGREVFVTCSIGISLYPEDADEAERLIEHAEMAMYRMKQEGRNGYRVYSAREARSSIDWLDMESRLRRALDRDELQVYYQPKIDIATGTVCGAEALVRWVSPQLGMVSPGAFIPLAEETGLIAPIGEWVMHTACAQAKAWRDGGHLLDIAVNVSARQFRDGDLAERVAAVLAATDLPAHALEVEITESMVVTRPAQAVEILRGLRRVGVQVSIDDFGTGYSSLSQLRRFPLNTLKVDQSFVRDLGSGEEHGAIVRAIVSLARNLGLKTVAEGVETAEQLEFLRSFGCDQFQGFHFSRPVPAAEFTALIERCATRTAQPSTPGGSRRVA